MTARLTAGKRLIRSLNGALKPGNEWGEADQATLDLIEAAADRVEVLRRIFAAETASGQIRSTRRVTEVAAELRQLEDRIHRWIASLDLDGTHEKSARHVAAANARYQRQQSATAGDGNVVPLSSYRRSEGA